MWLQGNIKISYQLSQKGKASWNQIWLWSLSVSEYQWSKKQVLNVREDSKHCGIKCCWNECDFKATTKALLEVHMASQYMDLVHDCDQCDYKVSFKHALKLHTESKHLRINYSCNECDYKPTDKSSLKYNLASQHLGETQTILILKQPTKVY